MASETEPLDWPEDCEEVVRKLWDYLDGELDEDASAKIDAHLESCEHCRSHADFERNLVGQLSQLRREHTDPEGLRTSVLATLKAAGLGESSAV